MTDIDINELPDDPAQLKSALRSMNAENARLKHLLELQTRARFGPKSERNVEKSMPLFDLGSEDVAEVPEIEGTSEPTAPAIKRTRGRRSIPASVPRTRVEHVLPADQCLCPGCHGQRKIINWITSEQVDYVPAKLIVIEHARAVYACSACEGEVQAAAKPPQPIDKGLAAPGLLAAIAVGKYGDHLPLYRMEEILHRGGFSLARSTQCQWMKGVAKLVAPVLQEMKRRILESRAIWSDDTTIPVVEEGESQTKTGRMWVYIGDPNHRYAMFDYTPDRKAIRPREFLQGYSGYLQADAYSGYNDLCDRGPVTEVGCWAHARRKFVEAKTAAPVGAKYAIDRIAELYGVEHRAAKLKLEGKALAAHRQEHALARLESLMKWFETQKHELLPKSPLAQAVNYALNQRVALMRYVEDGELSIDNNLSERTLRCVAIGRKNWLFAGNDEGGRTAAALMSLIASCKLLEVDPYRYLRDLFTALPTLDEAPSSEAICALLPDAYLVAHPESRLTDHGKTR